jgi:hypothetical protein
MQSTRKVLVFSLFFSFLWVLQSPAARAKVVSLTASEHRAKSIIHLSIYLSLCLVMMYFPFKFSVAIIIIIHLFFWGDQ